MKKSTTFKFLAFAAFTATALLLVADPAMAGTAPSQSGMALGGTANQSIGSVAGNITNSLRGVSTLITMICYLGALVFGIIGAMKWKAYGEQPDRTPFKIPVTYWGIAVMLAGFPEFMGTGITTLWGTGGSIVSQP